jgi:hypothetical protein
MRRILLAGVALSALGSADRAHAQMVVSNPVEEVLQQIGIADSTAHWAAQATSMAKDITTLSAQLQQAQMLYNMLNNPVALMEVAPELLTGDSQTPLGQDISATFKLVGAAAHLAGQAGDLATTLETQQTFYMPPITVGFVANMLNQRANQTAMIEAQLQTLLKSMGTRMSGLQLLQSEINMGGSATKVATLQARMQSEMAVAQQQGQQINALLAMATMQKQVEEQQYMQKGALDDAQFLQKRVSLSAGMVNFQSSTTVSGGTSINTSSLSVPNFPVSP